MAGQGPHTHTQLLCKQRNYIEITVCIHRIQLGKKIRKLYGKGLQGPIQQVWRVEGCMQNGKFGSEPFVRAVGWELDRQELST